MPVTFPISTYAPQAAMPDPTATGVKKQSLEQADFLKMLTLQLQNQDPMNPQSNTDFAAQMAQFTALEQSREMSTSMSQMLLRQDVQNAAMLLGTNVLLDDGRSGVVDRIVISKDGSPRIMVGNRDYALAQVMDFQMPSSQGPNIGTNPTP